MRNYLLIYISFLILLSGFTFGDLVDIDHMVSLKKTREKFGHEQVISGNIDPVSVLRDMSPESVQPHLVT
jgi:uroporphyrinogen-III decarboxylase